jgi:hypothetical protein
MIKLCGCSILFQGIAKLTIHDSLLLLVFSTVV